MMTLTQALLAQLQAKEALLSESNPFGISVRLTLFAARMHEVTDPETQVEMGIALSEIHRNVLTMVTGHPIDIFPVTTAAASLSGAVAGLIQYGIVFGEADKQTLEQIGAAVREMLAGLDMNMNQEVAQGPSANVRHLFLS